MCSSSSRDGQAITSVLGGWGALHRREEEEEEEEEEGGCCAVLCVCFLSLQHPSYQKKKITQAEFALQKPLPRQQESEQLPRQHGPQRGNYTLSLRIKTQRCTMSDVDFTKMRAR